MEYAWNVHGDLAVDDLFKVIADQRGITVDELTEFVNHLNGVRNPFDLPNINAAVERIRRAITDKERIIICGDYDVDGVTSTSVMVMGLTHLGANVGWMIPSRELDGYGLSERMVERCVNDGAKLLITVDNGIAATAAVRRAEALGVDVIVTDHHPLKGNQPTKICVDPFVDPLYPFPQICGCMVALKVLRAIDRDITRTKVGKEIVALTAIATVADAMPLVDENRVLVHHGLKLLPNTTNAGLKQLLTALKLTSTVSSIDVGFSIAPCLNAAGRMGDAGICVKLLLGDDDAEPAKIADRLITLNDRRKEIQRSALANVVVNDDDAVIIAEVPDVPGGVLGVIAGQIAGRYQRPTFAVKRGHGWLSGSGRSVGGFPLVKCVTTSADIATGGGHAEACGVSIREDAVDEFRHRCNVLFAAWSAENADRQVAMPTLDVTAWLPLNMATEEFVERIATVGPFGHGNVMPKFAARGLVVNDARVIGKLMNTVRMKLDDGNVAVDAIGFNALKDKFVDELGSPTRVDAVFTVGVNEWMGRRTIQLLLEDVRAS